MTCIGVTPLCSGTATVGWLGCSPCSQLVAAFRSSSGMHRRPLVAALELGVHPGPEATCGMGEEVGAAIPRLFDRQRVLVSLLSTLGGKMGESDVQGLLFDYGRRCRERGIDPPYDFIADEHRPRSFTAVADRDKLASRGILVSGAWNLTPEGHRLAGKLKNRDVSVFAARFREPRRRSWSRRESPIAGCPSRPQRSCARQRPPEGRPSRDDRLRGTKLRSLLQRTSSVWNLSPLRRAPEPAQSQVGILEATPHARLRRTRHPV